MRGSRKPASGSLLKFGVFALVTTVLTLLIAQQILGTSLSPHYTLHSRFDDVQGLMKGDPVRIAGVPVGQVSGIKVVDGRAAVTLAVDSGVHVPADTAAEMRWRNVLGQRYIQLVPGTSSRMLHGGGRIRSTKSVVDLSQIVNDLGPLTSNLDPAQLNTVLTAFDTALTGNETNINAIITDLDGLLGTFAARKTVIAQMIRNLGLITRTIAKRDSQIATSVQNLSELAGYFSANDKTLTNALDTLSTTSTDLNAILGGDQRQLGQIVGNLANFAGTFRINLANLEKMVQRLPLALRSLFSAGNAGDFLRTDALCLNVVQGPCPFPMSLPGGGTSPAAGDLNSLARMLRGQG